MIKDETVNSTEANCGVTVQEYLRNTIKFSVERSSMTDNPTASWLKLQKNSMASDVAKHHLHEFPSGKFQFGRFRLC